jgi:hypothetical protein
MFHAKYRYDSDNNFMGAISIVGDIQSWNQWVAAPANSKQCS